MLVPLLKKKTLESKVIIWNKITFSINDLPFCKLKISYILKTFINQIKNTQNRQNNNFLGYKIYYTTLWKQDIVNINLIKWFIQEDVEHMPIAISQFQYVFNLCFLFL